MLLMNVNVNLFPYLHVTMLAFILLSILSSAKANLRLLLIATFVVALMPVVVMISTIHPLPLGDDARLIGFAKAIAEDGRWIPYKYEENPYYQFFHLIPFLEWVLALIPAFGLENIAAYYLILKVCFYLMYLLTIYLVMKRLTHNEFTPLATMLLLSITPPLALTQVIPQEYAMIVCLITVYLLLWKFKEQRVTSTLVIFPLSVAGIVAHATYTIMIMSFVLPSLLSRRWVENRIDVARFLTLLVLISLAYWIYTYVLDVIISPTVNSAETLMDLLTGRLYSPFQGTAQSWYTPELSIFFMSWALIPAMVSSHILLSIIPKSRSNNNLWKYVEMLAFIGLVGTILSYTLRITPGFGGRYFYWLYLLMLPLSTTVIKNVSKSILALILCVILISAVSFYGIQDPTLSGNTYGEKIGWASRNDWNLALTLSQYLNPHIPAWIDPRISSPLSSLKPFPSSEYSEVVANQKLAIVGVDDVGLIAIFKDSRNVVWFMNNLGINPKGLIGSLDKFDLIINTGNYIGVWSSG